MLTGYRPALNRWSRMRELLCSPAELSPKCIPVSPKIKMPTNMSLNDFCNDVRIPEKLKSDRAPGFCGRNYKLLKSAKRKGIDLTYVETERKNQIAPIDVEFKELRKRTHNEMKATNTPRRLWDY